MKALNLIAVENEIRNNNKVANSFGKRSFFKFQIQESVQDILDEIQKNESSRWTAFQEENKFVLSDKISSWKASTDIVDSETLRVNCINKKYFYFITDNGDGTSSVEFNGPILALLQQEIIPTMSYISGTLRAMYEDMYSFVSIEEYCEIRRLRNGDERGWGEEINKKFNNEISCFCKSSIVEQLEECAA